MKDISCGADFACALTGDGVVRCWGRNSDGQLGSDAPAAYEIAPPGAPVAGLGPASAITSGSGHACAMLEGGRISCWGDSGYGAVGDGAEIVQLSDFRRERELNDRLHAVAVVGLPEPATAVVAGPGHTCAILASKGVACWGANHRGESGGKEQVRSVPRTVEGLAGVEELALGDDHTCARLAAGEVRCWGYGYNAPPRQPRKVAGLCAKQLAAGSRFTCALSCDDNILCWGDAPHLGRSTTRPSPIASPIADVVEIRAGGGHVCARDAKGRISCWGSNDFGQLGDPEPSYRSPHALLESDAAALPRRRPSPPAPSVHGAEARRICAGGVPLTVGDLNGYTGTTCAISTSGEVRCWGEAMETNVPTLVDLPR